MPIISRLNAKSPKGKILYAAMFLLLSLGGLSMIYPFAIMISGSMRGELDQNEMDLIPSFLHDDQVLQRKFLETKYNQSVISLNEAHQIGNFSFLKASVPTAQTVNQNQIRDFEDFFQQAKFPMHWQTLGGILGTKTTPENARALQTSINKKFNGDLKAFGQAMGAPITHWNQVKISLIDWASQQYDYEKNPIFESYAQLLDESPLAMRQIVTLRGFYIVTIILPTYGNWNVERYNAFHATKIKSFEDFSLPRHVPDASDPTSRKEWIEFVQTQLNPSFIILENTSNHAFVNFLRNNYASIDELNSSWGSRAPKKYDSFEQIDLPRGQWLSGAMRVDYRKFLDSQPVENLCLTGPEYAWADWLRGKYKNVEAMNQALNVRCASFDQMPMPLAQVEFDYVTHHARELRWAYCIRNYINVFDALFFQGRAFVNTVILCLLSILTALTINPLAAYALSRYRLPGTYKILLLLMATMSFPPMVTLIPTFIILRKLELLNTFAAIILPAAANGYSIFLLKGFFDSLPRELYEAATIDGAGEVRIFFQITMALSTPILAVVALGAFTGAYGAFLGALLVCPSQDMWMINVWLFQFQSISNQGAIYASVLVASIPTLLIFLLTQNIIMRGIVVPTEK